MESRFRHVCAAGLLILALTGPPPAAAQAEDPAAVVAVVHDLFQGMRDADTTKLRAVMAEGATLVFVGPDGIRRSTVDGFVGSVGGRAPGTLDERIWDWEVQIDGPLATLWTKYDLLIDGAWSHCGVDAFHLHKGAGGWRIFHLADTRRRDPEHCWRYPGSDG